MNASRLADRWPASGRMSALAAACAAALGWSLLAAAASLAAPAQQPAGTSPEQARAERHFDVGMYYFKKKNYDAAISRFQEALSIKADFAPALRYIGESHEKKGERRPAIEHYRRFLELVSEGKDAERIRKRLAKLERELERAAGRPRNR